MYKKILAGLLAVALVCGSAAVLPETEIGDSGVVSVSAETYGDFNYTILDDGTIEIWRYSGNDTEITIPCEINGTKVTSIGDWTFSGCISLTSISVLNGVTNIGDHAFDNCKNLISITIPETVMSMGSGAFYDCGSLTSITIPKGVECIEPTTFAHCKSLTSIMIPDSVKGIGSSAFSYCESIKSITIPNGVTSIGSSAFEGCTNISNIVIPDTVTDIAFGAFSENISITVSNNNKYFSSEEGILFDKSKTKLIHFPNKKTSFEIPYGVINIGDYLFYNCDCLTSITIPNSITSIGNFSFEGCNKLTNVIIPHGVTSLGNWAFKSCDSLKNVTIPNSVVSIGMQAFMGCTNLTSIIIPASVTKIETGIGWAYGNNEFYKIPDFKIYCYSNTAGEQYAKDNGFDYTLIGDISGDGKLSTADVGKINAAVRGTKPLTDETQKMLADINGDGKITTADVGKLNAYVRGTLTKW